MLNYYSDMEKQIDKQLRKFKNVQGLMRYINVDSLYKKHELQNGYKATGIDKVTKGEYDKNIKENLEKLIQDMKAFRYKPKAVRRVMIPKPNGKERPLGIPSYEDKLVQAQMAEILSIIFENYFKDFSYGFRPGRDCHQAIKKMDEIIMHGKVNWIVEADIKGFFDNVDHDILIRMLEVIIKDRDFIRLVKKFLRAGYMYKNEFHDTEVGTPQGGIISPILANLYLHVALDDWFDREFKKLCKGEAYIVRYADDFVCMFQYENDARMFYTMLVNRFAQFKLEVEPTKTKIFPFGRYAKEKHSFDFLGFTISNGKTRNGYYRANYSTSMKKSKAKYEAIVKYIKDHRNLTPESLIKKLNRKLRGMFNYYGISSNYKWMIKLYKFTIKMLKKWLSRRSQRGKLTWEKLDKILEHNPIVKPKISFKLW